MKKTNKKNVKLELKIKRIVSLSHNQMERVNAGDDASVFTRPGSIDCIPPYNAPPYLTQKYCTE